MTTTSTTLTYNDPHYIDGDCYEVAKYACNQAAVFAKFVGQVIDEGESLVLNAEMQRALDTNGEVGDVAREWDENPLKRKLDATVEAANELSESLAKLAQAAGWNPKAPLDG